MTDFAVINGDTVVNVIVAESREIAEAVTGLLIMQTEGEPWIGWTMESDGWRPPSPFPSWVWNGTAWEAPIPYPSDDAVYTWDENAQAWTPIPVAPDPEPAPEK